MDDTRTLASRWAVIAAWAVPLRVLPSLGLVQRWGEWFPTRLVAVAATAGATLLIAVCLYAAANAAFHVVDHGPVLVGDENAVRPEPGAEVIAFYLPLALWGPLVLAVARDFRRRHAS